MKIIHFFITRKITTFFVLISTLALGIFSYSQIPASLYPDLDSKGITIIIRYPGQSPYKIEEIITRPVEIALSSIGGIEQIISSSEDNQSRIYIYFEDDVDIRFKSFEVREKIEPVKAGFPRDVNEPEVYLHSNEYSPVAIISLSSNIYPLNQLRDLAEKNIKKQIERIDGIAQIEVGGGAKREIVIETDNNYLLSHSLSMQTIAQSIQDNNFIAPIGILHQKSCDYTVSLQSKFTSLQDISSLPLAIPSTKAIIPLSHFSTVSDYAGDNDSIARYNGKEHICLYIYKTTIANPLTVSHAIQTMLKSIHIPGTEIKIIYNEAADIKHVLHNLYVSCFAGIILTVSVLYAFLKNISIALPAVIAIPFSLMGIGIYLYSTHSSLNIITLSGIAIAIGMVVDNSIIVIEHITKNSSRNNNTPSLIAQQTSNISKALLASSLTTIVIFFPFVLLKEQSTATYIQLAGVVIIGITASYIVAVIFVPWLFNIICTANIKKLTIPQALSSSVSGYMSPLVSSVYAYYTALTKNIHYHSILAKAFLNKRKIALFCICMAAITVIPARNLTFEQFSYSQQNKVFARLELPSGSSLAATAISASAIENQCRNIPFIMDVTTKIEPSHADFIFTLKDPSYSNSLQSIITEPHDTSLIFTQNTGQVKNQIDIVIKGRDILTIRSIAQALSQKLSSTGTISNIIYHYKEERPQLAIIFDRETCANFNIPIAQAGAYIRNAFYGPVITKYIEHGQVDVRLKAIRPLDINSDIASIRLPYQNGIIALNEIATIKPSGTITTLWHYDKMRAETLSIIPNKDSLPNIDKRLDSLMKSIPVPDGYYIEFGKSYIKQKETKYYVFAYILIAVVCTYIVLGAIFESFILPLVVMISIPFSWIVALWVVYIFNISFNIATAMGFIVLTGTVVNNSILLIDTYNNAMKNKQKDVILTIKDYELLLYTRFRGMCMTTLTTSAGLFPLLFSASGNALWHGFAITIITGLCSALVFIIIATPLMYDYYIRKFCTT